MSHFEALYAIFTITVRELIRSDVDRLTLPSTDARGQQIASGEALKNKIDLITQEEWKKVHKIGEESEKEDEMKGGNNV